MRQIITCLDAGSSKIKLIVGEVYKNKLNILACSEVRSKGIKKGVVVNQEEALVSIKTAVSRIENVLEIKIKKIICLVPSYFAEYILSEGTSTITSDTKIITGEDILRTFQGCVYNKIQENKDLITIMPIEFWLDGKEKVKDPKNKKANKLSTKCILAVTPKKNTYSLISVLEALKIEVADICFSFIGDYYEFKKEEYSDKNIAVVNIGADTTEIGIFHKNIAVASEVIQNGGRNIDRDIAYIYDISLKDAHKLKETFAHANTSSASMNESEVVLTKSAENIKINQYEVSEVVYSRLKEILEEAKKQINFLTKKEISYIIVTGGTSEILNFESVVKEIFGKKAIIPSIYEMGVRNNKFSSSVGFIKYYYDKLKLRNKVASTISEEDEEEMFNKKKKVNENNILGKIYGYFFDN